MTTSLEDLLTLLLSRYRRGRRLALLMDYDGTLVPLAAHPRLATMPPRTRRLLRRLAKRSRVALGILSGRGLDELQALVSLSNIFFAGNSGLELDLRGLRVSHPGIQDAIPTVTSLANRLQRLIERFPGAWLEGKMAGLTVHYRNVADDQCRPLQSQIKELVDPYANRLRFTEGPKAIEIIPELGWDKGTAVQFILEHLGQGEAFPLYAGDAPNDDAAFEVVDERGGICIGVGPDIPPFAHCYMADSAEFLSFLAALDKELAAEEPGGLRFAARSMALQGHNSCFFSPYRM